VDQNVDGYWRATFIVAEMSFSPVSIFRNVMWHYMTGME
jgi:hypothetical protein